ncbi:Aminoglycoside-2''-adenylyltransferase [Slackia heliotrinireducens]|uniref:Aminoglycoside-2''-adenylyltransferase n=1 Tax=Slackia heliotrinireducens (strain ATCC 29202 / DSM 20476 / NCTC 11029 / RHS 1) TaxID=471855 RepID=C7N235_SLAHD|nr:nucleotidyltransferase family protein [Slackia heliotrinireducens]ACV21341.1 Aminoglycoside-2''-adenylyltransferase [Slackia heliotrinireducens DSM 20476]VEG98775.1 Aminoglycoside-2''-adenylyltransferase [Slackia heliotrinireducens]
MITENDAREVIRLAADAGIAVWLDGGWGIDALMGRQTRPHNDIDIFVQRKDADRLVDLLVAKGFAERLMPYTLADHTTWEDKGGRTVDLHVFDFADDGRIVFLGESYPGEVFSGKGTIGDMPVDCIEPASQLMFHLGYDHDENDLHDVLLLCQKYGFDVPDEYLG